MSPEHFDFSATQARLLHLGLPGAHKTMDAEWGEDSTGWATVLRKAKAQRRTESRIQQQVEQHRSQLEAYEALCQQLGEEPADVALAWLLHNPAVTAPIIGPRTVEQLTGSLRALKIALSEDTLRKLDEIWPGPGGEAPKAYAW